MHGSDEEQFDAPLASDVRELILGKLHGEETPCTAKDINSNNAVNLAVNALMFIIINGLDLI